MISTFKHKRTTWIDLESPTPDEVKSLMKKYPIHPLVADELLRETIRPKVDVYKDSAYLVFHFPFFDHEKRGFDEVEIDFIIGKNFLITTHYRTISSLVELTKVFEADSMLNETNLSKNTGILFFYIIRHLYTISLKQLDYIQNKIGEVEDEMFEKKASQYDLVRKISHIRRDILDFSRTFNPHREVFSSFEHTGRKFFGADFPHYLNNLVGEYYKVRNTLENNKETIVSLQETNDSLLSNKTNEVMKVLTIVAFITFPLAVFTSLFGMNTVNMPIVGMPGDFWIILGVMVLSTSVMFGYFKYKKWI